MKKKNGFTLVELLAVIVILAIIMIIAIPTVLETMASARRSSFAIYIEKVVKDTTTQYVYDSNGGAIAGAGRYVYNIEKDLGYTSTGDYKGYVVVNAEDVDNPHYIVYLWDSNYMTLSWDVTDQKMPKADDKAAIQSLDKTQVAGLNEYVACKAGSSATVTNCYNRQGYKIVE